MVLVQYMEQSNTIVLRGRLLQKRIKDMKLKTKLRLYLLLITGVAAVLLGFSSYSEFVMPVAWDDQEPEKAI